MAANAAIIGALKVILGTDNAALEKGFDAAESRISKFGGGVGIAATAIAGALTAMAVGVSLKIDGMLEKADKFGKLAQSAGMPVEQFSKLAYAADLSDVSVEQLGTSMGKLSKNMSAVAGGATGPAAEAFKAMGIQVTNTDGTLRASGDVLADIAGKFKGYEDGAAKTALAIALFGKSGADMIPLLNQGRDGLRQAADEAERYGVVIDEKTARAAEGFNDNMKRMHAITAGIWTLVTAQVAPALERLSQIFLENKENGNLMKTMADGLVVAIQGAVQIAVGAVVVFQRLGVEMNALWQVLKAPDWESMKKAWADFQAAGDETARRFANIRQEVANLFDNVPQANWDSQAAAVKRMGDEVTRLGESWTKTAAPIIQASDKQKNALESFLISQQKHIAQTEAQALTVGKSASEQERMKVTQEALAIATANNIPLTDAYTQRISALGDAAADAAMKLQGAQLTQEVMTPAEKYAQQLALQQQLFDAGAISAETLSRAQKKAAEDAGTSWDIAGASIAGSFKTISSAFGKENSAMAKAAQVFGAIQAAISMWTGAAKALELPFPANLAAMASVLATGASLVASIKSQKVPNFATGGAMMVGGVGGIDSQRIAFDASPGEIVSVHQNQYGASNGPGGRTLNVEGITPDKWFSGRQIIEMINAAISDGSRLKIVPA